jgi:N-acetylglucosaminyldiphosphoundecaprenol N-acetyl-beta-D-mannosaminyltransferase
MISKEKILGVGITNAPKKEILEYVVKNVENFKKKLLIVTPNPEFLVLAGKNNDFKNILNRADLALADGVGVVIASKFLGKPLKSRFAGVDLVESLCREVHEKPITVGFLGGRGGVAEGTAECLRKKYSGLKVAFVGEEWSLGSDHSFDDASKPSGDTSLVYENISKSSVEQFEQYHSKEKVRQSSHEDSRSRSNHEPYAIRHTPVDILFVAFGAPKQEFWIDKNLDKIPVKVAIGVGGAFDYISGKIPRAPKFIRNIGFEWLFRLIVQPWRIKRQLALMEFILLVTKEKINKH